MSQTVPDIRRGSSLFGLIAIALTLMAAGALWTGADAVEGIRLSIRMTARSSLLLFACAFAAAPLYALWPNDLTTWLRRNRRWLGLGFAWSHGLHAMAILSLYTTHPATFWQLTNIRSIVTGGIAYLFILLLAITSFDRAVLWLGRRKWSWLHTTGAWIIWGSFIFTNGKRIPQSLWYAAPVVLMLTLAALRLIARVRRQPSS